MRKKSQSPSPLNPATRARYDMVRWEKLSKEDIIETGEKGRTFLHYIAIHGHWDKLCQELKEFSLTQPTIGGDKIIHLLARNARVNQIPTKLITKELLNLEGAGQESVYHILASENCTHHIPKEMWDREALTKQSESGLTPLHFVYNFYPDTLPTDITLEDLLLKTTAGHTPLHAWASEDIWTNIPEKYLTPETLKIVGRYDQTLLNILANKYKDICSKEPNGPKIELTRKMQSILRHADSPALKMLSKNSSPNLRELAKTELSKRKVLKSIRSDCPVDI